MGRIVVSENVSLDGIAEDPTGEEGSACGGWFLRLPDKDRPAWAKLELDEALCADALLLGRRSDAWFAARWLSRSGQWADRLNSMPKYVVSASLRAPKWSNATVLTGNVVDEVSTLRRNLSGDIVVYASMQLVHTLMAHDLVDELRLVIHPVVVGAGAHLFGNTDTKAMGLVDIRAVGESLVLLTYSATTPTAEIR